MRKSEIEDKNKKVNKNGVRKFINIIEYVVILTIIILNISTIVTSAIKPNKTPDLFGKKAFIIISGSMIPTINIGDIVFLNSEANANVQDIIGFKNNYSEVIVHRIVDEKEIDNEIMYQTKGDNNNVADIELVKKDDIEGVYFGRIPYIGKIVMFLHKNLALVIIVLVLILIIKFFL